ncbi:MAG: hypothetical protein HUU08_14385 [Candidatus Brocadia sp.]|nr:hypothetical protein [Candidatus Brocadia sp.]
MNERLLGGVYSEQIECARNDNVKHAVKVHGRCHCEGIFPKQSPRYHKRNLVAAVLRLAYPCLLDTHIDYGM